MNKKHKISLMALIATCALSTSVAVATLPAYAEDNARLVTINGNSIFQTLSNAEVSVYENAEEAYPLFLLNDSDDTVVYRKNLAYSWYKNGEKDCLNLSIGFKSLNFDNAFVKFQSQQQEETKDGVSNNYIVFVNADDNSGVYVYTTTDDEDLNKTTDDLLNKNAQFISAENAKKIDISLKEIEGEFVLDVEGREYPFVNVGGSYAKYVSSSKTHPATPLTFGAKLQGENVAEIVLYELNDQSFRFVESSVEDFESGAYTKGQVRDDQAPVVCLDDKVSYIEFGKELSVSPVAIDVLASSPTVTPYYYILNQDQVAQGASFNANDTEGSLFTKITEKDEVFFIDGPNSYYPETDDAGYPEALKVNFDAECLAKVYYEVTDVTSANKQADKVLLEWYVENTVEVNGNDYICVGTDTAGVKYKSGAELETAIDAYQAKLDELTQDEHGQPILTAGSSEWLYLPSVEDLFELNSIDEYEDLKFSIYYNGESKQNRTGLQYNGLSINVKTNGYYTFTVFATDVAGNAMYYLNSDGEMEEITASEIWNFFEDDELAGIVPWFSFNVGYKAATVETPKAQDTAYVGTRYTADKFDINGVTGKYTETYTLTLFDRERYTQEIGEISYAYFIENISTIYEENRDYFKIIPAASTIKEEDSDYELNKEYSWNSSSLSFVPQEEGNNSFYVIRLVLEDTIASETTVEYMAISVSAKPSSLRGDSEWLENNLATVILFSIAAVSFIGIVVLFVLKPKMPKDLDAVEGESVANKE
ncbi:MAG: hypothetical protein E7370_06600 [Clostridiales bacterium]|nr:hypothetical protein [Clostridiales bacterium]